MSGTFRKHYSYGETIPTLETHVGLSVDIFEEPNRLTQSGPYLKAALTATAGPFKSPPLIIEPLQENVSKIMHLSNIPVPVPQVKAVDISLISDLVNYRWTPSAEGQRGNGVVTFDLRLRAAFSLMGRSYTLQLDQRPCTVTLTKQLVLDGVGVSGAASTQQRFEQTQDQVPGRSPWDDRVTTGIIDGSNTAIDSMNNPFTKQLDIEEHLREIGQRVLARTYAAAGPSN
jgi:hypothetical protein